MHNLFPVSNTSEDQGAPALASAELPAELRDAVDTSLQRCFDKTFNADELLGDKLTQLRGPLDSLSKRHGLLLEKALAHAFYAAGDRYDVTTQVAVKLSREVMSLVESNQLKKLEGLNLAIDAPKGKTAKIDIVVFDFKTGDLHVISVKRGGGNQGGRDAGDERKDLTAAALLLRNHTLQRGLPVLSVKQVLVDWYGRSGISARKLVTRETIDEYFGLPIAGQVEAMSAYMKSGIAARMTPRLLAAIGWTGDNTIGSPEKEADTAFNENEVASKTLHGTGRPRERPSLAECLSDLPRRRQGRQMRSLGA